MKKDQKKKILVYKWLINKLLKPARRLLKWTKKELNFLNNKETYEGDDDDDDDDFLDVDFDKIDENNKAQKQEELQRNCALSWIWIPCWLKIHKNLSKVWKKL